MSDEDKMGTMFATATKLAAQQPEAQESPVEEVPPEEVEAETETPADEQPKPNAPDGDDPVAGILQGLTHQQVQQTPAGKGLVAELQRERQKRQALEDKLSKLETAKAEAEPEAAEADALAGLAEDDLVEVGQFRKAVTAEVKKAMTPLNQRFEADVAARQTEIARQGAQGLLDRQKAGEIPAGVNVVQLFQQAASELEETQPEVIRALKKTDDPVAAIWGYAVAALPSVQAAIGKASRIQAATRESRAAQGRSLNTGRSPGTVKAIIDVLKNRGK